MVNPYLSRASFVTLGAVFLLSGIALVNCTNNNNGSPNELDAGPACYLTLNPTSVTLSAGVTESVLAAVYYRPGSGSEAGSEAITIKWSASGAHFDQASTSAAFVVSETLSGEPLSASASMNTLVVDGPLGTYAFTAQATTSSGCVATTSGKLDVVL